MKDIGTLGFNRIALCMCAVLWIGCGDSESESADNGTDVGAADTTEEVTLPPASDTGGLDAATPDTTAPDTAVELDAATSDTETTAPADLCADVNCLENASDCVIAMSCDPKTGQCTVEEVASAGTLCDADGDVCTQDECDAAGECMATDTINDCAAEQGAEPCWVFACDPQNGCQKTTPATDSPCDDGNECTENDTCTTDANGVLSCTGTLTDGDDDNECTQDSCDNGTLTNTPLTNTPCTLQATGQPGTCNDGVCTDSGVCGCGNDADCGGGDLCSNVKCIDCACIVQPEDPCDDGLECTIDVCDSNKGCDHILDTANYCWISGAQCVDKGTSNPENPCLTCDPSKAVIIWSANDGASCDDNDPNTCDDTCAAKQCVGGPCS